MRILICFSYNGACYSGFQKQNNAKSIQQTIETALSEKLGQQISLTAPGRTDAGVHALCQYAHFDANLSFPAEKIVQIAKVVLPEDIKVYSAIQVADDFHARKNVKQKTYMYVFNKNPKLIPFLKGTTTFLEHQLDIQKMKQASKNLVGTHNFKAFCSAGSAVKDFNRTIYSIDIAESEDNVVIKVCGNGFLYNMVRIIVGTLVDIGTNKLSVDCIEKMIETGDRNLGGRTAKPQGLYLYSVEY